MARERTGRPVGRPPGRRNIKTEEARERAERFKAELIRVIPDAFTGDAHDFLQSIYRDPQQDLASRIQCAIGSLRFEKPALASTEHRGALQVTQEKTMEQLRAEIQESAKALGAAFVAASVGDKH